MSGRGRGRGGAADAGREAAAAVKEPLQRRKAGLLAKDRACPPVLRGRGNGGAAQRCVQATARHVQHCRCVAPSGPARDALTLWLAPAR
jgi:hypothetical protein